MSLNIRNKKFWAIVIVDLNVCGLASLAVINYEPNSEHKIECKAFIISLGSTKVLKLL